MSSPRGDEPDQPVQRGEKARCDDGPAHDAVSIDAIAEFEALDEAKRVERMAELQIVEQLRRVKLDPSSSEWREFAEALVEYGYAVLVAWGVTGALATHAAKHGGVSRARVPANLRLDEDDARALAAEVLLVANDKFRTKSLAIWSPTGGASLKTFFIGRCLMELADVYQAWHRRERRSYPVDPLVDDGRHGAHPDEEAEARVLTDQLLDGDPDLRTAFELQAAGYGLDAIAKSLKTTPGSVRSRMYRFRQGIQPEDEEDPDDGIQLHEKDPDD